MAGERFVVVGLARPRADWFGRLTRDSTAGLLPVEFLKCVSAEECRAHLHSGRVLSALLVDEAHPGSDRDLLAEAAALEVPSFVVLRPDRAHPLAEGARWLELGATATLPGDFTGPALLDLLDTHAHTLHQVLADGRPARSPSQQEGPLGRLVAVTGAGGSGSSTTAMALAQGMAARSDASSTLLVDACLDGSLAMVHATPDVTPGLSDLVEAHRTGHPAPDATERLTFACPEHGYHLLVGLANPRDWTALRLRAVDASISTLLERWRLVVADTDPEVEGEAATGSIDVEERNVLARTLTARADLVMVTARPSTPGLWRLVRILGRLLRHGVEPLRLQPVLVGGPGSPAARARLAASLGTLVTDTIPGSPALAGPLTVPHLRRLDGAHHDAVRLPPRPCAALARTIDARLAHLPARRPSAGADEGVGDPIAAGSLGSWSTP